MNAAQLDAFNRHIARMEDEAIQAKRMSIIELNINKQFDDKEHNKKELRKNLKHQNTTKILWQRE